MRRSCSDSLLTASQPDGVFGSDRGNDTALCFVLRAVNCILSDEDQPNTTINRLWDVLDQPELNSELRQNSRMTLWQKKPPAR